jgi:hypothetical protein
MKIAVDDAAMLCLVGVYPNQTSGDHPETVTFSGKWHGFFSAMWRDRSGAWGRPSS